MKRTLPRLAGFSLLLLAAACSDTAAPTTPQGAGGPSAISFGAPDRDDHPYVGVILFVQNGVGYYGCSGTLVSPTVMITAGHCVESEGNLNDVTYVRFTEDALADIDDYPTLQAWLDAEWIVAAEVVAHPEFDDFAGFPSTYDVGVVILSEPVILPEYGVLPEIGLLESIAQATGRQGKLFTAVGYGIHGLLLPFAGDDFSRRQARTMLIEARSTQSNGVGPSAKFTNNPGIGGGTCNGDSGGPILYGDTNIIAAITSFGYTPCIGVDFNFRLDTEIAQDFLAAFLE